MLAMTVMNWVIVTLMMRGWAYGSSRSYGFGERIREGIISKRNARRLALKAGAWCVNRREELLRSAKQLGYVGSDRFLASQAAYPVHEERTVALKNGAKVNPPGAGRHLLALINDILDLSKIEAGRMELNLETFALLPLIDDVVKTIEPLAAKNGNQVMVHCDAGIGTMHADQMRLRQALLNLMSNANKFTEKGNVTIAAHQGQENGSDWITLSVADTGSA